MLGAEALTKGVVDLLIVANADAIAMYFNGLEALWLAAEKGHWEIVSTLVSANADVQCVNEEGYA